ncbi:ATP-binding cassette domain-containing protein, partial [Acinetobacter baumannii]|uniref:ATP-binding cassette domain-containing protein n=2 Tax=Acinetobacter baumannii TaxID=470 RepID=UPI000A6A6B70
MSLIIKARNIRLDYAGRDVLDIDELEIHSYDRIGLVGDNGAGKSSLLKVLNGALLQIVGGDKLIILSLIHI